MPRAGYMYILASKSRYLYVGVTSDMCRRWFEHRTGEGSQQARDFRVFHLVHVEQAPTMAYAIRREKQVKGWLRRRKIDLIERNNPGWNDLAVRWGWHRLLER